MQPSVEIDVDETSGVWRTDGLPMLYVPRHFFVNLHRDVEAALGREAYREVLARSGARSALRWCRRQSELGVGDGPAIFAFYLERLSARGWGRFSVERMDAEALSATVSLRDSIYVLEAGKPRASRSATSSRGSSSVPCSSSARRSAAPPPGSSARRSNARRSGPRPASSS